MMKKKGKNVIGLLYVAPQSGAKKMSHTHRYNIIPLLHFCPGGVLTELVVRLGTKISEDLEKQKNIRFFYSTERKSGFACLAASAKE